MTSNVVEIGLPNLVMLLVVIRTMIQRIVVVSIIFVGLLDTTVTVLDLWIIAIIQQGLGRLGYRSVPCNPSYWEAGL